MNTRPIVVGEMQGASSLQVVQFLAVSQRETGESFEGLTNREVLSFHVARRDGFPAFGGLPPLKLFRLAAIFLK